MNSTYSSDNTIQIDHFDIKQSAIRNNRSFNNKYDSQTPSNNKDNVEDWSHDELDNLQHL